MRFVFACFAWLLSVSFCLAEPRERAVLEPLVVPPFSLGQPVNDKGVWTMLNAGGAVAGYVFETEPLAPLPGFSGASINVLVALDLEGNFHDVRLLDHNEPIFVSGLGTPMFQKFFEQYRGHNIASTLVVGTPYGESNHGGGLVYLDGVTKATASVRIAHESILAAVTQVARERTMSRAQCRASGVYLAAQGGQEGVSTSASGPPATGHPAASLGALGHPAASLGMATAGVPTWRRGTRW